MLLEFDLAGAEWVVVAYLSGDPNMLSVVESGISPHVATGGFVSRASRELVEREHEVIKSISDADTVLMLRRQFIPELLEGERTGEFWLPRSMTIRQACKKANHGLNYDMRYRRFALENEMPEADAKPIVELYRTEAYPGLVDWHESIKGELKHNDRTLENLLGRKVRLLDQPGPDLWDKAYSFKPQSTVADIVLDGMCLCYEDDSSLFEPMVISANVHDSLLFQYPAEPQERVKEFARAVRRYMSPALTALGREFVLGVDIKAGPDWGHMHSMNLETEYLPEEWGRFWHVVEPSVDPSAEAIEDSSALVGASVEFGEG